jgi:hypothetical protein
MVHPIVEEAPAPRALDKTGAVLASAAPPHDAGNATALETFARPRLRASIIGWQRAPTRSG